MMTNLCAKVNMVWLCCGLAVLNFGGLASSNVYAQVLAGVDIIIEAQDSFEWRKKEGIYVVKGDVTLRRGQAVIQAEKVLVYYREIDGENTGFVHNPNVYRLVMEGGVLISSPEGQMIADKAVYDADKNVLVARGKKDGVVSVEFSESRKIISERVTYWMSENRLVGEGTVEVFADDAYFRSDVVQAFFEEDEDGDIIVPGNWQGEGLVRLRVDKIEAHGDLRIEVYGIRMSGEQGVVSMAKMEAEMCGQIRAIWQDMKLSGDCAVFDIRKQSLSVFNIDKGDDAIRVQVPLSRFGG